MEEKEMSSDKVAELLVKLYSEYEQYKKKDLSYSSVDTSYAKAVAIAIRMLTD